MCDSNHTSSTTAHLSQVGDIGNKPSKNFNCRQVLPDAASIDDFS